MDGALKLLGKKGVDALACLRKAIPDWDDRIERERFKQTVKEAPVLAEHGGDRKSEEQNQGRDSTLKGKRDNDYLTARLKRDAPDIATRLERGEFKSVRAAAIEAGIVHVPTRLERALKAYFSLNKAERESFWDRLDYCYSEANIISQSPHIK